MKLKNVRILIFVENEYEDLELQYPKYRMIEEGALVKIAGPEAGKVYKGKNGYPCQADISLDDVRGRFRCSNYSRRICTG